MAVWSGSQEENGNRECIIPVCLIEEKAYERFKERKSDFEKRKREVFDLGEELEQKLKSKAAYENLSGIWMGLNKNEKFWQTISESALDKKTSGGASREVNRIPAKAIDKLPFFVESNVQPFGLKIRKQKVYFLPDKLLVISRLNVGALNYSDVDMDFGTTRFVETDAVPKDAHVVGQTWLKVNKNGTPDKRFKNNRQAPVCEYGEVLVKSGSGLHIELMCSNSDTVKEMRESAAKFAACLN